MLFNSLPFLYIFLPVTYLFFWRLRSKNQRYVWMAIAGYVFYSFWNYKFCALMAFSTLVSYSAGLGFLRWPQPHTRRLCLVIPIVADLALLGYFKYANLALSTFNLVSGAAGSNARASLLNIVLPIGISFYTFHTITYIVDSYRRVITPTQNFFEFACYVSLFPQLVAGPIVRFRQIEHDLETINEHSRTATFDRGASFFLLGMIKKVLIADTIATIINPALGNVPALSTAGGWLCSLGYTYQLYFDFSGYSDMAVGLGLLFGLQLPQNFNSPYKADSVSDFWRRWHISLSTVLRDYLYIPLGGNRGSAWFSARNVMITMVLGGLWHGANWTFVVWGGYHGALLVLNRVWGGAFERVIPSIRKGVTFFLVNLGWVLFRADSFSMAGQWLRKMFAWSPGGLPVGAVVLILWIAAAFLLAHFGPNTFELKHQWSTAEGATLVILFGVCLFLIYGATPSPFLYFQF